MAGKRGGFFSKMLGEDSSKRPLTDADRDAWLKPGPGDRASSYGGPQAGSWGQAAQAWGAAADQAPTQAAQQAQRPQGVDVTEMSPDSPLGQAGIEEGDTIVAVNGRPTPTEGSLGQALNRLGPGERAEIRVIRDDEELSVTIVAPS